jgi:hypothetical protein
VAQLGFFLPCLGLYLFIFGLLCLGHIVAFMKVLTIYLGLSGSELGRGGGEYGPKLSVED